MIHLNQKTAAIFLLLVFISVMVFITLAFIKALFMFPSFRKEIWIGITDGDKTPHQDDYQRTAQLFWSTFFGSGLVCSFLLWMAFPGPEWRYITGGISLVFLACVGLRKIKF
jgi:hypothetical protein